MKNLIPKNMFTNYMFNRKVRKEIHKVRKKNWLYSTLRSLRKFLTFPAVKLNILVTLSSFVFYKEVL
jgi:hypothetical protein